ncbi:hypothetical protein B591_30688 (plasmid) [Streptomyces sp. GBA 94-10 4N24]|nr:hypothetical protein B591_30688 [Streptomyces sp. GBA 94-10 4N24]UZN63119.1 hypothetical protein B591N_30688 [Streptomyces sp. GBA 94-10 4N24]
MQDLVGYDTAFAYSWQSYGNKNVAIRDERSDSKGPYTLYDRVNNHGLRLNNNNGAGSTVYSGSSTSNYVQKVTACLDLAGLPDACGYDDRPGDGR